MAYGRCQPRTFWWKVWYSSKWYREACFLLDCSRTNSSVIYDAGGSSLSGGSLSLDCPFVRFRRALFSEIKLVARCANWTLTWFKCRRGLVSRTVNQMSMSFTWVNYVYAPLCREFFRFFIQLFYRTIELDYIDFNDLCYRASTSTSGRVIYDDYDFSSMKTGTWTGIAWFHAAPRVRRINK